MNNLRSGTWAWAILLGVMSVATLAYAGKPKGGAAPAGATSATAAEVAQCKSLCESRDNVSCPNAPKEAACNASCATFAAEAGPCREKFDAWLEDLSKASWGCDSMGYPKYQGSYTGVASGFAECFGTTSGAKPKPVPTPAVCGVSSNDYYCDGCLGFQCSVESEACGANAECKAIESCLDKCPDSNSQPEVLHACVEKCKSKHPGGVATFEPFNKCANGCGACGAQGGPDKSLWDALAKPAPIGYIAFKYCTLIAP